MPIELSGMSDLLTTLGRAGKNVRAAKSNALNAGAEVIRSAASKKAPRGSSAEVMAKKYSKGQHMADHIAISPQKSDNGGDYVDVGPEKGDNSDFFYGKFFEYGTTKMEPKPFMEPSLIESQDEALDKMADVIREAIDSV